MNDLDIGVLWADAFEAEVEQTLTSSEFPITDWRKPYRGGDEAWWQREGPLMVEAYASWRQKTDWKIWYPEHTLPAIELEAIAVINGVQVKAYIDRVFVTSSGEIIPVDLKTGTRTPFSTLQLALYARLIEIIWKQPVHFGAYWMAKKGDISGLMAIDHWKNLIGGMLWQFVAAREQGIYIPHVSDACGTCLVSRACAAYNGHEAKQYDPDLERKDNE